MADLPIKELGDEAPEYDRPWIETPKQQRIAPESVDAAGLQRARRCSSSIGSPDLCSKRWV